MKSLLYQEIVLAVRARAPMGAPGGPASLTSISFQAALIGTNGERTGLKNGRGWVQVLVGKQ